MRKSGLKTGSDRSKSDLWLISNEIKSHYINVSEQYVQYSLRASSMNVLNNTFSSALWSLAGAVSYTQSATLFQISKPSINVTCCCKSLLLSLTRPLLSFSHYNLKTVVRIYSCMKGFGYKSLNRYVLIKISAVTNHMLRRAKRKELSQAFQHDSHRCRALRTCRQFLCTSENAY